ncbi:MAG: NAD(P)-dependent oxidoreductase, partial [Chloroflexi bacterium]|nr:NAD(P)-dependent oxidoreductase [Chloroflexota bacterium]
IAYIKAFFGSRRIWQTIQGWDSVSTERPTENAVLLNHGYDEAKSRTGISIQEVQEAARFRGGECLSKSILRGDWRSLLTWRCHDGHEFPASLNLILRGGHWCPVCMSDPSTYDRLAQHSPFFQQVWESA